MWQAIEMDSNLDNKKEFIWGSDEQPASKLMMNNESLGRTGTSAVLGILSLGSQANDSATIIFPPRVCLFQSQIPWEIIDWFRIIWHREEQVPKGNDIEHGKTTYYII